MNINRNCGLLGAETKTDYSWIGQTGSALGDVSLYDSGTIFCSADSVSVL